MSATVLVVLAAGCAPKEDQMSIESVMSAAQSAPYSRFDDAGLAEIERSRVVKVDLRSGTQTLAAPEMALVIDGPLGRESLATRTIAVETDTVADSLSQIVFWESADSVAAAIAEVRYGIGHWGFNESRVENWAKGLLQSEQEKQSAKTFVSCGVSRSGWYRVFK